MIRRCTLNLAAFLAILGTLHTAEAQSSRPAPAATKPRPRSVSALVIDLDDPDPVKRAAVLTELRSLSVSDIPSLNKALLLPLSEVNRRAIRSAIIGIRNAPKRKMIQEKFARDRLLEVQAVSKAYRAAGRADPRWSKYTDEFFTLRESPDSFSDPRREERLRSLMKQALDAGCDDPYLRSLSLRLRAEDPAFNSDVEQFRTEYRAVVDALLASKYPAFTQFLACNNLALFISSHRTQFKNSVVDELAELGKTCLKLFPKALADAPANSELRLTITRDLFGILHNTTSADAAYTAVNKALVAAKTDSYLEPLLQVLYYSTVQVRWNPGDTAGPRKAREVLDKIRQGAELAWQRNHTCILAANYLIAYAENDEELELWFLRATENTPDNFPAHDYKLQYLLKNGSKEAAHEFALQCLDHDSLEAPIPMIITAYHYYLGSANGIPKPGYFADPQVFVECQTALELLLNFDPDNVARLSVYAQIASWAERWDIANAQFTKLGDRFDPTVFPSKQQYNYSRKKAASHRTPASAPATTKPASRPLTP